MVMAVNESVLKQGVDESMQTKLQILRQRRQLLEERLNQKNNELKNLCLAEAELTGILPAEIPLEPGESPPILRRRLVMPITNVPQRTTKTNNNFEADELELERQIQIGKAEAALRIINDLTENRAIRRKQRSVYQQCQRKLQELDARLNFIRQQSTRQTIVSTPAAVHPGYVHSNKHRMKKPRPPLTGSLRESYSKPLYEQGGVSLSPQEPELHYNRDHYDPCCQMTPPSASSHPYYSNPMERMVKMSEHEQNINNNIYIQPDQFRCRTWSQGAQQRNTSPRGQARYHEDRQRSVTNAFGKDDRQSRYYHDETDNNVQKLPPHYRYPENQVHQRINHQQNSEDLYPPQKQQYTQFEYQPVSAHEVTPPIARRREPDTISEGRAQGSPRYRTIDSSAGYYVRHNGEIVWCPDDKPQTEKFGSLDRRKQHLNSQNVPPAIAPSGFRPAVSSAPKSAARPSQVHVMTSQNQIVEHQQPTATNRILRTQSLGSVESRQSNRESPIGKESNADSGRRKEKGWYETSLDSNCSQPPILRPSNSVLERHYSQSSPRKEPELPYRSRPAAPEPLPEPDSPPVPHVVNRYYDSPKVLEIPAESNPLQYQEGSAELTIPLNSPSNHTVVQPGKYQPYREVTKPFEMSDFYKYSTKFRKRNEANQMAAALTTLGNEAATENKPLQTQKHSDQFERQFETS